MALLQPQIERHYDHELRWQTIVAANVIKVRYPRAAHALLRRLERESQKARRADSD
jgi:hypothetical protein